MAKMIREEYHEGYTVVITKLGIPVMGGHYEVSLKLKQTGDVLNSKDGLSLDAATEVFKDTVNAIKLHKLSKMYGA